MRFVMNRIKYFGQEIDKNGKRPDPARASAIKDMPSPENFGSLQSFQGLENYYNAFVPNSYRSIGLLDRVFANSPGDQGSI